MGWQCKKYIFPKLSLSTGFDEKYIAQNNSVKL